MQCMPYRHGMYIWHLGLIYVSGMNGGDLWFACGGNIAACYVGMAYWHVQAGLGGKSYTLGDVKGWRRGRGMAVCPGKA